MKAKREEKSYSQRLLEYHNSRLPKDPKEFARQYFIEEFGFQTIDVPVASDAKGTHRFSRYRLRDFLKKSDNENS
jgi:hypothetical protein